MINNPIVNDFLVQIVAPEDLKNIKAIIQALIDGIETDEAIHEKTDIKLNTVRKLLYKLHDASIATYKRNKDPETQWFTYSWKFETEEVISRIRKDSEKYLKMLNDELEREENNMFFICPQGHVRLDFDESSDYEFLCPACGEELEFQDNTETIEQIKEDIKMVESNFNSFTEKNK
jgi:transcription initiation factor TFIIE subunit alpha